MRRFFRKRYLSILLLPASTSFAVYAKVEADGQIKASDTFQQVQTESDGTVSSNTVTLSPSLNIRYQSKTFTGKWTGTLTHLERSRDDLSLADTYGEYKYAANWSPIDNVLFFDASGFLNYRNGNTANFLLSDFLTNSEDLVKTRSNRLNSTVILDRGGWIKAAGNAAYSDTATENSVFTNNALDNDTFAFSGSVTNGDRLRNVIFDLRGSYENTAREDESLGDFVTRLGSFYSDFIVLSNWALRATAFHEANQVSSRVDSGSLVREFNSYGIGLTYRQNSNRYISVTINKSDFQDEDNSNDDDSFVGLDMAWAFSPRTSLSATYGRRFYGESASARFSYNTKFVRTSFDYSENVTNTSRLLANQENLGVFVCPSNSVTFSECFQPNSLTYTPSIDEQLVELLGQNIELQDNVILRKSGRFQAGYDFSKVTVGFSWLYTEDDYIDQERLRRTYGFGSNIAFQLGQKTSVNASVDYANVVDRSEDERFNGESDNYTATLGLNRKLGQHLFASFDLTLLKQEGDILTGLNGFGNNYTDRRISASITYKFE